MQIAELYEQVTSRIVKELESGVAPWVRPWKVSRGNGVGVLPTNACTGTGYRGVNICILWDAALRAGYPTNGWMTYRQALSMGGQVRKGERGATVVFTKRYRINGVEDEEKTISMLKTYTVFNSGQIDGLPDPPQLAPMPLADRLGAVQRFIDLTGAQISHGGGQACYVPSKDFVNLPPFGSFKTTEGYYATALHELTHWSGAPHRLNRDLSGRFGTRSYAAEELIAELGAAFLCAHLNIEGDLRHASYLKDWLDLLKQDNRAIFTAASKASQAADFLRAFSQAVEAEAA